MDNIYREGHVILPIEAEEEEEEEEEKEIKLCI